MTRLAVLADIHGNLPALEAVMNDMTAFAVDHVVVAGDVVNWGPFSEAVMEVVTREGWAVIRGNNEYYLLDYNTPRQPSHWKDYRLLPWLYEQLEGHWHRVIAGWPDEVSLRFPDAPPVRVVHGQPGDCWRSLNPLMSDAELIERLDTVRERTLIGAHSHLAMSRIAGAWHVVNPGSVGIPLDGQPTASYAILDGDEDGWRATFRRVPFDRTPLFEAYERQRFVERYGPEAALVVKEIETSRLWVHPFQAWRRAHHAGAPVDDALLAAFLAVDPRPYMPPEYHWEAVTDGG